MATARKSLALAMSHLDRAKAAAIDPVDWLELATFGFYALEAAVVAAALHVDYTVKRTHPGKVEASVWLSKNQGLPDVARLLVELNSARKAQAYGDTDFPAHLDSEDVSQQIEEYVDAVDGLVNG
jgi:hypothetical protein